MMLFSCPVMSNSATPWTTACQTSLSLTISQSLPKFIFIASVMPSSHLVLWCPLLLPSVFSQHQGLYQCVICLHHSPKYWSFSFSISPSNEYSGLIFFRIEWFDLLVQGTRKSLLQHHNSKHSSAFSLLYGPILTSVHDWWKSHTFDYTKLCWLSDVSAF